MGTCGFHCWDKDNSKVEMGYDLLKDYWGNGYMQEALKEIIKFSREKMLIKEINAHIFEHNKKSIDLIEKLNFKITGSINYTFRDNEYLHKIYSLNIK
jgi:ribosomal-protein-alanine N-acetyltransferase